MHWNMVAFACVCLVRVSRQQTPLACDMHDVDIPGYLHRLVQVLRLSPVMDQPAHRQLDRSLAMIHRRGMRSGTWNWTWT